MKKFFAALLMLIMLVLVTDTAFAANWVKVYSANVVDYYVDKSSIKRGIKSRPDAFTAVVRWHYKDGSGEIKLLAFINDKGTKKFAYLKQLAVYDHKGKMQRVSPSSTHAGWMAIKGEPQFEAIYNYVKRNLP